MERASESCEAPLTGDISVAGEMVDAATFKSHVAYVMQETADAGGRGR